jgi:hypothetical protein
VTLRPSKAARARQRAKLNEPGRAEWKAPPPSGKCEGCGKRGKRIRHHVVREQDVRRYGGDPWDQANQMLLGRHYVCRCHEDHHAPNGRKRLSRRRIPAAALDFASRLLGENVDAYLDRHYAV